MMNECYQVFERNIYRPGSKRTYLQENERDDDDVNICFNAAISKLKFNAMINEQPDEMLDLEEQLLKKLKIDQPETFSKKSSFMEERLNVFYFSDESLARSQQFIDSQSNEHLEINLPTFSDLILSVEQLEPSSPRFKNIDDFNDERECHIFSKNDHSNEMELMDPHDITFDPKNYSDQYEKSQRKMRNKYRRRGLSFGDSFVPIIKTSKPIKKKRIDLSVKDIQKAQIQYT